MVANYGLWVYFEMPSWQEVDQHQTRQNHDIKMVSEAERGQIRGTSQSVDQANQVLFNCKEEVSDGSECSANEGGN